ncbi:MAG: c-type cytochrome [Vicinamibacteria bacterium]|nr:c-type cytochrome [Vicinamibacteria bacterium]
MRLTVFFILIALVQQPGGPPYSPQSALSTFRVEPGFRIELVTSEPDITSPVAMDIDEDGRWFVVEMPGYPLDTSPSGRIKLLEDTNGDGRPDKVTVFADQLVLPTGVMRWKRGVLVTAAPDVLYLEDSDGDGKADKRTVVLTGFAVTNPQHSVNGPTYGLDNWIHLAYSGGGGALIFPELFGDRGKPLTFPGSPSVAGVDARSRAVRFRLDPPRVEPRSSDSQYGNTFDTWGHYFTSENNDHIRHEVVAARYLERNPQLPVSAAARPISDHGGAARVFPITANPQYELLTESGEFTSACSLTMYTGGLFQGDYARSSFVAEPVHNLVHRDVIEPSGSSFVARRGSEGREFLASTDPWFRPVNFYVGPDGALYVVDYYRARIEHPEWTASEFHKNPAQFTLGRDRGRIYRIVPDGTPRPGAAPHLSTATDAALVQALSHTTLWWRRTAQRLLLDRRPPQIAPALETLARQGASPFGRLHALWTLDGLGVLDDGFVVRALGDTEAGVRENALRLAESRLAGSAVLQAAVLARAVVEQDARVQFQLLATLGGLDSAESRAAHQQLFFAHLDDPWMQVAALSAGPDRAATYLQAALLPGSGVRARQSEGHAAFFTLAGSAVAATREPGRVADLVAEVARGGARDAWWQAAALEGVRRGMRGAGASVLGTSRADLLALAQGPDTEVRRRSLELLATAKLGEGPEASAAVTQALALAANPATDAARRADAISLAALGGVASREAQFEAWVDPREPEAVQVAALAALTTVPGEAVGRFALKVWPTLTPGARTQAIELLQADPARERMLVEALRTGAVQSWAMNFWQKRDLIMHRDPELRAAARALLEDRPEARAAVVNRYAAAVERGGSAERGGAVFAKACAACHKVGNGTPTDLGPDLSGIRHRPPLALLVDVLSPNQSIAQGYETYVIERANGRSDAGTLADQTPTTVTLRQAGQPILIPRGDIKTITMLPQSSMPTDLDKVVSPGEMADLLAFLTKR